MARLFTFQPAKDSEPIEDFRFDTAVTRKVKGGENRRSFAPEMLRDFEYPVTIKPEFSHLFRYFFDTLNGEDVEIPDWFNGAKLSVDMATANQFSIGDDSPLAGVIESGMKLVFYRSVADYEVATVFAVVGDTVTLSDNAANLWAKDTRVYPVLLGKVQELPQAESVTDQAFTSAVRWSQEVPEYITFESCQSLFEIVVKNTYVFIVKDNSGSMNAELPAIDQAANDLKSLIRDTVYNGDQALADEFVVIIDLSDERWVQWMSRTVANEQSSRYFVAAYINESSPYHNVPHNIGNEPTSSFLSDLAGLESEFARRDLSAGKVYSVNPQPGSSWEDDNQAFNAHFDAAFAGSGGYGSLSTPLVDLNLSYQKDIQSGQSAQFYLNDIISAIVSVGAA